MGIPPKDKYIKAVHAAEAYSIYLERFTVILDKNNQPGREQSIKRKPSIA
jgi:hypothetical protein